LNVASLFLVRSTGRVREFAIRSALGSGGGRIARQLLVESVLLSLLGGALGLALGVLAVRGLRAVGGNAIPRLGDVGLDPIVLTVTAAATLLTGLMFGMAPAVRFARMRPGEALRRQSRSSTADRGQSRMRSALVALQVACALMLLTGAGVLAVSFYRLQRIDFGIRSDGAFKFEISLPSVRYPSVQRALFHEELARRILTIPGVVAAGGTSRLPATGEFHSWASRFLTGPRAGTDFVIRSQHRIVSGDFFHALTMPVLAGRVFDGRDDANAPARAVVSARFAKEAFPGTRFEDVLGHRFRFLCCWEREIIGVVGDVPLDAHGTLTSSVYHAHRQYADNRNWALTQVVASTLPMDQILAAVRAQAASLDPELVVYGAATLADAVGSGVSRERFTLALMGAFALIAIALAAIGLYGVLAYAVRERTQEFGVRIALGASPGNVRGQVIREASSVVGIGVITGIMGALALSRWLSTLVYETSPRDPSVFVATTLMVALVALASAALPAWRASRVEPRVAMNP
jgi:putative ABC transport system permease protein